MYSISDFMNRIHVKLGGTSDFVYIKITVETFLIFFNLITTTNKHLRENLRQISAKMRNYYNALTLKIALS